MSGPFDDLIPGKAPGAIAPRKGMIFTPPPDSVGQQKAAADLTRTRQEIAAANATASSNAAKAAAEAQSAEIKAKNDQEAYNAAHPKGSTATVLGPDSLKSLSAPDQELVKALAEGRLAFPSGFALKAPWWQQKLEQVAAYDPTFDATNYNNRAKARAALVSGKLGTSANALNTAIGHIGLLSSQIGGTASHSFTPANAVINTLEQITGDPGITNYKDTASKLASELTSVYRNGGGAEQDVVRQLQNIDPNASLAQKQGIVKNALELLASKQAANLYQYNVGSGGKPPVDLLDPQARAVLDQFPDIRDKYFASSPAPLSSQAAALLHANGGTPPPSAPPTGTPPGSPPPVAPGGLGGVPHADYSPMVGGPNRNVATMDQSSPLGAFKQTYRQAYDPVAAETLSTFIRNGASYQTAADYATSHGFNAPDPKAYAAAVAFQQQHPKATPNVEADRTVPTTLGERLAASPAAAGIVGAASGATAGLSDVIGRTLIPGFQANRSALAATNPGSDIAGNVGGGLASAFAAPVLLGRFAPQLAKVLSTFNEAHPVAAPVLNDMAYGGLYGANENPDHPLQGGLTGAITAGLAGRATRAATSGLSGILSPSAGPFQPLYDAGGFPTIGQKLSATGGIGGKIVNTGEQALQSFPGLGMMVAGARQAPRDAGQIGAFNNSLKELAPFGNIPTALPPGMGPGTDAHAFTSGQFDKAYDTARSGMQFVPDAQYLQDAQDLAAKVNSGVLSPDQASQVQNVVNNAVVGRLKAQGGTLNGDAFKAASSDLNRAVQTWGKNPATAPMAEALSDYQSIFDNAARRNSDPAAVNLLDSADRGYAQLVRIQRASELGGAAKDAGTFTPVNYAQAVKQMGGGVRSNAYNQGVALGQDYANALLPLRDTLPTSGTSERLLTGQALAGLGGAEIGAGGFLAAHPGSLAPFAAYVPGVRDVINRAIAPNAQRLSLLPPDVTAALDAASAKIDNLALPISQAVVPGALAYRLSQ